VVVSFSSRILIGLALISGALAGQPGLEAAQGSDTDTSARTQRLECFELRSSAAGPAVGYASLHRTDSERGTMLEWQINFPDDELDIWHTETLDASGARWIWRERQERRSRSVVVERKDAGLNVTEWGRQIVWRRALAADGSSFFPLELEERLRAGEAIPKELAIFDPMGNDIDLLRVVQDNGQAGQQDALRRTDLVRPDGTLAASWTFHGGELLSFAWQRGGLIAVRVAPERFASHTVRTARLEAQPPATSIRR